MRRGADTLDAARSRTNGERMRNLLIQLKMYLDRWNYRCWCDCDFFLRTRVHCIDIRHQRNEVGKTYFKKSIFSLFCVADEKKQEAQRFVQFTIKLLLWLLLPVGLYACESIAALTFEPFPKFQLKSHIQIELNIFFCACKGMGGSWLIDFVCILWYNFLCASQATHRLFVFIFVWIFIGRNVEWSRNRNWSSLF